MRYAIIKDSKVVNVIEANEVNANIIAETLGALAVQSDIAGVGQNYADEAFSNPAVQTAEEKAIASALSQTIFTKLQIRRAMRELGNESSLDALLAASAMFARDWADAAEIDLSDAMTQQALEAMTVDIDAIKLKIAGIE